MFEEEESEFEIYQRANARRLQEKNARNVGDFASRAIDTMRGVKNLEDFSRLEEFFKMETDHLPDYVLDRMRKAVVDFKDICESHIEMLAMLKMMSMNINNSSSQMPRYPIVLKEGNHPMCVTIVPQVELVKYRADFVVGVPGQNSFLVECDGKDFHDEEKDAVRDLWIEDMIGMRTLRLTGSEIWTSNNWLSTFHRWCNGRMVTREEYRKDHRHGDMFHE